MDWKRLLFATIGAGVPVLIAMLSIDSGLGWTDLNVPPPAIIFKYIAAWALAIIVVYLYQEISDPIRLITLAAGAPAIMMSLVSANSISNAVKNAPLIGPKSEVIFDFIPYSIASNVMVAAQEIIEKRDLNFFRPVEKPSNFEQFLSDFTGRTALSPHIVVIASVLSVEQAQSIIKNLKDLMSKSERLKNLPIELYYPFRGNPYYAIGIGGWMSYEDARILTNEARKSGVPDAFVYRVQTTKE